MSKAPLLPVDDAIARIGDAVKKLPIEFLPVAQAGGRVLGAPMTATLTQPPFDGSAMDGYAIKAANAATLPATLSVIGESAAGKGFGGIVGVGDAVRIFTGAPLPSGADAVVMQENCDREGDKLIVKEGVELGRHIRLAGGDFKEGETYLQEGTRLTAADIALLAAMNIPNVPVFRKPKVAFFATGNELVRPGDVPGKDQIVSSNSAGLTALISEFGGEPIDLGIARDTEESLRDHAARGLEADLLISIGGASVGDHDLVQSVLGSMGLDVDFWRIAMRPGKPLIFGQLQEVPFIGLPGNPVSALVCGYLFLRAAIEKLQGRRAVHPPMLPVVLTQDMPANDSRRAYVRATLSVDANGRWAATPVNQQDSSMLSALSASHCLIMREIGAQPAKTGDILPAILLRVPD
jgi:molybdopterin molybdotransferase